MDGLISKCWRKASVEGHQEVGPNRAVVPPIRISPKSSPPSGMVRPGGMARPPLRKSEGVGIVKRARQRNCHAPYVDLPHDVVPYYQDGLQFWSMQWRFGRQEKVHVICAARSGCGLRYFDAQSSGRRVSLSSLRSMIAVETYFECRQRRRKTLLHPSHMEYRVISEWDRAAPRRPAEYDQQSDRTRGVCSLLRRHENPARAADGCVRANTREGRGGM